MKIRKLVICGLATVGMALSAATASANEGMIQILGKCLDVENGSDMPRTPVILYDCSGSPNQLWQFDADGTVRPSFDNSECLDVSGGTSADGTLLDISPCNSPATANQTWDMLPDGTIETIGGKCLDDPNSNTTDGTQLEIWDCHSPVSGNQSASFSGTKPTALSSPQMIEVDGKCLNVSGGNIAPGTSVITWECRGTSNELWHFESDGTVRPAVDTTKCLDVESGSATNGTTLDIWPCNSPTSPNQTWSLDFDGTMRTIGGKCLDDPNGTQNDGVKWDIWDCHSPTSANQSATYFGMGTTVTAGATASQISGVGVCLSGVGFTPGSSAAIGLSGIPQGSAPFFQTQISASGKLSWSQSPIGNEVNCTSAQDPVLVQVIDNTGNYSQTALPGCLWCTGPFGCSGPNADAGSGCN
jgi:hypothetical protein